MPSVIQNQLPAAIGGAMAFDAARAQALDQRRKEVAEEAMRQQQLQLQQQELQQRQQQHQADLRARLYQQQQDEYARARQVQQQHQMAQQRQQQYFQNQQQYGQQQHQFGQQDMQLQQELQQQNWLQQNNLRQQQEAEQLLYSYPDKLNEQGQQERQKFINDREAIERSFRRGTLDAQQYDIALSDWRRDAQTIRSERYRAPEPVPFDQDIRQRSWTDPVAGITYLRQDDGKIEMRPANTPDQSLELAKMRMTAFTKLLDMKRDVVGAGGQFEQVPAYTVEEINAIIDRQMAQSQGAMPGQFAGQPGMAAGMPPQAAFPWNQQPQQDGFRFFQHPGQQGAAPQMAGMQQMPPQAPPAPPQQPIPQQQPQPQGPRVALPPDIAAPSAQQGPAPAPEVPTSGRVALPGAGTAQAPAMQGGVEAGATPDSAIPVGSAREAAAFSGLFVRLPSGRIFKMP